MRNGKKMLNMILVVVLVAMTIIASACSNSNQANSQPQPSQSQNQGAQSEAPKSEAPKPVLKALAEHDALAKPETDDTAKATEERTGYKVQYSMLPADDATQKLSIELAGGADYDLVRMSPEAFRLLVSQNALMPLNDLLNEYGQNVLSGFPKEAWELTTIDGKIYGIPKRSERLNLANTIGIRTDMLDEVGLKTPTTIDEFYNALKAIKDKNKDIIPLTSTTIKIPTIMSAYGLYNQWMEVDGKVVSWLHLPAMKEYLSFMTRLYNEGLLDKDLPVNKSVTVDEKFAGGKAAATPTHWKASQALFTALYKNNAAAKTDVLLPLIGKNGEHGLSAAANFVYTTVIPKSAKNPVDAMKFMNARMDPANFEYLALGTEGVTFDKKDGKYTAIMPALSELRGSAYWYLYGIREEEYSEMWLARLNRDEFLFDTYQKLNASYDQNAKFNLTGFMPPIESYTKNSAVLNKMENDYFLQLLVGGEKIENFDAFVKKWDEAGGAQVAKDINEWYYNNGGKQYNENLLKNYPKGN